MVWQFIDVFKKIGAGQIQDDDFTDRLSHRHTVIVLLIFCVLVGSSQYVGSPISCWVPAHFSGSMTTYTNNICWITNTYYVPTDDTLPNPSDMRDHRINYYQWVPFILILMALLFYAPWVIWHVLSRPASMDTKSIMKIINKMDQSNTDAREKSIGTIVKLIDRSIEYNREPYTHSCLGRLRRLVNRCFLPLNKQNGSYIATLYMIVKFLYVVNVCGQFFLLNTFMGPNFNFYGFDVMRDLWYGRDFWESPRFPRITMCDFVIRTLGENNQRNTVQCTLPINLFNEKIFIFLWFWLVVVATFSVYNFLIWFFNFTTSSRTSFLKRHLRSTTQAANIEDNIKLFEAFVFEYLKQDGVFLLRLIKKNTNDLVVGELISALWIQFKRYPKFLDSYGQINNNNNNQQEKLSENNSLPTSYTHI